MFLIEEKVTADNTAPTKQGDDDGNEIDDTKDEPPTTGEETRTNPNTAPEPDWTAQLKSASAPAKSSSAALNSRP